MWYALAYKLQEIQHAYHTNALLVKILLSQAQANGVDLSVDTNTLENEFLLKTIANSESIALGRPASDFVKRNTQLGKIAAINVSDVGLEKRNKALQVRCLCTYTHAHTHTDTGA